MAIEHVHRVRPLVSRDCTVLLIDDHPVFRAGLASVLVLTCGGLQVLEASSIEEAERRLAEHPLVSLILYDWHLPPFGGFRGLQRIRHGAPRVPVVVISADDDDAIGVAARQGGAIDVMSKSNSANAIRARVAALLGDALPTVASQTCPEDHSEGAHLSGRQLQVLDLLARGCTNKRIADLLDIQEPTVRAHVTHIFKALKVKNRTQAALEAARLALVGTCDSAAGMH
jgi:DNA-binding NarL/FixJ family response regulator